MTLNKWETENAKGVVIIVHGAGEHIGRYQWLINQWNQKEFHVVGGDLPGCGTSPGKKGHIKTFQQYIDAVNDWYVQAKQYRLPVILLGHSLGGLIVIRTLMEKQLQVCCTILSSPCLKLVSLPPLAKRVGAKLIHRIAPSIKANSGITFDIVTRNETLRKEYEKDPLLVSKVSVRWYQELNKAMKQSFSEIEKFPNSPLLILQAGHDLIVDKTGVKRWFDSLVIDDKSYKEWKELYHEVFNEPEREEVFAYAEKYVNLYL